ncbi:MAG: hypothetical protein PHU25_15280 [Deltaproteobacteria bacterium]|nr:hypothetical protein [Deltaproteobacteria bacterium]
MAMEWRLWLGGESDDRPFVFGALGEHSCCGAGAFLVDQVCYFADIPSRLAGPEAVPGASCVVAVDAPLLARDARVAEEIPDSAGCLLVVPTNSSDDEVEAARAAMRNRATWIALAHSPVEGHFGRGDRWDWLLHASDQAARLVTLAFAYPDFFARFRENAGTMIVGSVYWGGEEAAGITGRPLGDLFAESPVLDPASWRVVRARWLLEIASRPTPSFLATLDRALASLTPEQRAEVDIRHGPGIRDDDPPHTLWRLGVVHTVAEYQ